jgi:hypothetical protein
MGEQQALAPVENKEVRVPVLVLGILRLRCPHRGLDHLDTFGGEDLVEGPSELGVAIADEELGAR